MLLIMNRLKPDKQKQVIAVLVEGNSIRSTCRITGVAKNTVIKLLRDMGAACDKYQDRVLRNLKCKHFQCDEIWSFCYAKEKNVPEQKKNKFGYGDVWTFTAICADTKLVPSWYVGRRNAHDATIFMKDLADRLANRIQITSDGHRMYIDAVEQAFAHEVDFSQLVKLYENSIEQEKRYSPARCSGIRKHDICGNPKEEKISTSYVERQNLTVRMSMRRFTRLTNGFSKKVENLASAVSLHFMHYNFCRVHQSLRVTPAMEAGVADHVWSIEEMLALLDSN